MVVTLGTPVQLFAGYWRLTFTSGLSDPTFYVYVHGELEVTTKDTSIELFVDPDESPVIDVLDDANQAAGTVFPGRLKLTWFGITTADFYLIEEFVSAVWTERGRIFEDKRGYYSWRTRWLEDVTTHQFRVTATGLTGNSDTPATLTALMVRHPDVPNVTTVYSSGTGKVTFTAV